MEHFCSFIPAAGLGKCRGSSRNSICVAGKRGKKEPGRSGGANRDEELERITGEFHKKQKREEEKKEKRKQRLEAEAAQKAGGSRKSSNSHRPKEQTVRDVDDEEGLQPLKKNRTSNPATQEALVSKRKRFRPEDISGVRFGGSYTFDPPSTGVPEVAFIGRSNVGKSSTINCLTGLKKKIAKTSKQPGRTQQINFFPLTNDRMEDQVTLVDLPGYGFAKIGKETQREIEGFLEKYFSEREELRMIIVLVDSRREPQPADLELIQSLRGFSCTVQIVLTKIDLLKPAELVANAEAFAEAAGLTDDDPDLIFFSAVTGQGRGLIWQAAMQAMGL